MESQVPAGAEQAFIHQRRDALQFVHLSDAIPQVLGKLDEAGVVREEARRPWLIRESTPWRVARV